MLEDAACGEANRLANHPTGLQAGMSPALGEAEEVVESRQNALTLGVGLPEGE